MQLIETLKRLLQERSLGSDAAIQQIFNEESRHGAVIVNRVRYVLGVGFLVLSIVNSPTGNLLANLLVTFAYFAMTAAHTYLLYHDRREALRVFDYLVILFDFTLIYAIAIYYNTVQAPNNMAHTVKNPLIFFTFLPIALTLLQFKLRLVLFSTLLFLLYFYAVLGFGFATGIVISTDWGDYVLGPGILLNDVFMSRPLAAVGVGIIIYYGLVRVISLLKRIAQAETQKASLARYFSPDVAEEISNNPEMMSGQGRQIVSILFSDIRGFTAMSEAMTPDELGEFLTDFRGKQAQAVFANGGSLDKFIGDAIMANFGVPKPSPDPAHDAENAVRAGIAMMGALQEINQQRAAAGKEAVAIGIGIHSGEVFAGNLGSAGHMEYTVIGDTVNTASRIESLCKKLGADFLISEKVFTLLENKFSTTKMPRVKVKGKAEPLRVYQVNYKEYL